MPAAATVLAAAFFLLLGLLCNSAICLRVSKCLITAGRGVACMSLLLHPIHFEKHVQKHIGDSMILDLVGPYATAVTFTSVYSDS